MERLRPGPNYGEEPFFLEGYKSGTLAQDMASAENRQIIMTKRARKDAMILLQNYGCDDPITQKIYKNMKFFVENPNASSSTVGLYESKIMPIFWGVVGSIYDVPHPQRPMIEQQIHALMDQKRKVISCTYGPFNKEENKGYQIYEFWYKSPPENIEELLTSLPGGKHPLRVLGFSAVETCPPSPETAYKTMRAGAAP